MLSNDSVIFFFFGGGVFFFFPGHQLRYPSAGKISAFYITKKVPIFNISEYFCTLLPTPNGRMRIQASYTSVTLTASLLATGTIVALLTALGTDYWLLASSACPNSPTLSQDGTSPPPQPEPTVLDFLHEGFLWRCSFRDRDHDTVWKFLVSNQPHSKLCSHSRLFPLPGDSRLDYDDFIFGFLYLLALCLYLIWTEGLVDLAAYANSDWTHASTCVTTRYGWSFGAAWAAVPLALFSGLLFLLIGWAHIERRHNRDLPKEP
uniref:Transmembrane protein 182a n=2 Tax=Eptatretus burgeri TaxID=7764 RepID=A0A8C4NDI7_EPTBU